MAEQTGDGGDRRGGRRSAEGDTLEDALRRGASQENRDTSVANIHTGSGVDYEDAQLAAPPEGAPPPEEAEVEGRPADPGTPPPTIEPIDVEQQAGGGFVPEARPNDHPDFPEPPRDAEARAPEEIVDDDLEDPTGDDDGDDEVAEVFVASPAPEPSEPSTPSLPPDDTPEAPTAATSLLDEDDLRGGTDGTGALSVRRAIDVDFGDDGAGAVRLTMPPALSNGVITSGGEPVAFSLSADGSTLTASADGAPVFTVSIGQDDSGYYYEFELQGAIDHGTSNVVSVPLGLQVTDADGDTANGNLTLGIVDDAPVAHDDPLITLAEGGGKVDVTAEDGLLANDELGADGAVVTSFTYTGEDGQEHTAQAGDTVDTEHGTLTVNADGSWRFESDTSAVYTDGESVLDGFTYSITDADGDTSAASQSIEITDTGPKVGDPAAAGGAMTFDEDDIGGAGATMTQGLEIDFGADGEGSVALGIPAELEQMGLTSDGEAVEFSLADDGQSIVATAGGEAVFTISLSEQSGEYSYTFELQGTLDHTTSGEDTIANVPFDLTVTDGDGSAVSAAIHVNVVDGVPEAADEGLLTLEEGGAALDISAEDGLLANDDLGPDGGRLVEFTYVGEDGQEHIAAAGETVDTEHGRLTVNADGSWSFETDPKAVHADGESVLDGFTYTVEDNDGDRASARQQIAITDQGPEIPPETPTPPPGGWGEGDQPDLGRADLVVDEDAMGAVVTQAIDVDFGADGFGSAELSVPQELNDLGLTSNGETISYTVSKDGQSIVASAGGEPVFTVTLNADSETGQLSYSVELQGNVDHAADGAGDDLLSNLPVTLTVTDGDGTTASTTLEVGIRDDAPAATDDGTVTLEEGGATLSVSAEDGLLSNDDVGADGGQITSFTYTGEDGQEHTTQAGETVDTEHGWLTVNADGSWSFESDPNAVHEPGSSVTDGFTYTITDGDGDTASATQAITITDQRPEIPPPSPPPPPPGGWGEGDQSDLGRADLVVDEDAMGAVVTQAIDVDFGADGFGSAELSVPQELNDLGLTSNGQAVTFEVAEDGQSIVATADGEPVFTVMLNADSATGQLSYSVELQGNVDHAADGAGDDLLSNLPVTLTVTDGDGTKASTNLEIGIVDDAPTAADDGTVSMKEGGAALSVNADDGLLSNDDLGADGGEITSFTYIGEDGQEHTAQAGESVDTEHGQLTVNADGSWSFETDPNAVHEEGGTVAVGFTYTVTDGDGDTATATQAIEITDEGPKLPPPTSPPPPPPGGWGEGDQPDLGRADLVVDEDAMGMVVTQAIEVDFGADGFGSAELSVPQALEDMGLTSNGQAVSYEVSEDGQSIVASAGGEPVFTVTLNADADTGSLSYSVELQGNVDHAADGTGDDLLSNLPVTLTVTDGDGTTASTNLEIGIVDDAPTATDDGTVTLEEGGNALSVSAENGLLANDEVGADGGEIASFTYVGEDGQQHTADAGDTVDTEHGRLTVNADGSWSFETDPNAVHTDGGTVADGFSYTVMDGDGDTATATQAIEITDKGPKLPPPTSPPPPPPGDWGEGDQPDIGRADLVVDEDAMGEVVTQAIDADFGADGFGSAELSVPQELNDLGLTSNGETISYTVSEDGQSIVATAGSEPVFTVTLNADSETGQLSYSVELQGNVDHAADGAGDDLLSNLPVTLTVTDGDGTIASTTLEIGIRDDAPAATDDGTVGLEEGGATLSVSAEDGLLSNDDVGADGGEITSFTYTGEDGRQHTADAGDTVDTEHGQLTVNADGSWSFETDPDAVHDEGTAVADGFTYTVTDGDGDTATASQRITITDQGPEIPPETPTPPPGGWGEGDQPDLGRADLVVDEDAMGTVVTQAIEVDFGADGFGSAELSVPQELNDLGLTSNGQEISYSVSEDGQSIVATAGDEPVFTVTLNADSETGSLSYSVELQGNVDHAADGAGDDLLSNLPVTLTVTDGDGTKASTNLEIGIVDDSPTAADDGTVSLQEGGSDLAVSVDEGLLANDDLGTDGGRVVEITYVDEAGETQTAAVDPEAGATVDTENGKLTVNADGSWSFETDDSIVHEPGSVGVDGFTYTVEDGDGDRATAAQNIVITDEGPSISFPAADDAEVTLDEGGLGDCTPTAGAALDIDFGADGVGEVTLSIPDELAELDLTSGGEPVTFTVAEDGQSIVGTTPDGSPVLTISLDEDGGEYSYQVELQGPLDHGGDVIEDIPVTLTVTDGDGSEASATLTVNVLDDAPVAIDDGTFTVADGGHDTGSGDGAANLLANDDLGADGAEITSFTYTGEDGAQHTAETGETVDTQHGALTVNADGSWTFTSDADAVVPGGEPVMDNFTYTITDGDGDTSTAQVTLNVIDGTVDGVDLTVDDAQGYEDTAIPLSIGADLADQDGSEVMSVTLSDIPEGAVLTYTDQGGNTVTLDTTGGSVELAPEQLNGLAITPPADSDHDFDLSVSVTATEASTGDTVTHEESLSVTVDAVADATTVSAGVSVSGGDGGGEVPDLPEFEHDLSNVVLYIRDDETGEISKVRVEGFPDGDDGVRDPNALDVDGFLEENYPGTTPVALTVKAGNNAVAEYGPGEGELFILDNSVGADDLPLAENISDDNLHSFREAFSGGDGSWDGDAGADGARTVTISVDASFGDYTDGSEDHFVLVEVPDGWAAPDGMETVDGGTVDGLPDKTFVRIEVADADLSAGDGTVSVSVEFTVPADQDTGALSFEVISEARETNLSGGELTEENNVTYASTTVSGEWDGADGVTVSVDDAQGYEDTAIPLSIGAVLNDTDGSEVMSVTLSDVPEGAVLTYTDGDGGTVTLDTSGGSVELAPEQLNGLAITPPADSDHDFDLSVSVTATETATGQTVTHEESLSVTVDAVADETTVNASYTAQIVGDDAGAVTGDITVTNVGHATAGFHNSYGYYVKDEDGNPTEGKIVFADVKDGVGDSYTIEDVDPDRIGFFVIPDGARVNDGVEDGMEVGFRQDADGKWHVVGPDGETLEGDGSWKLGGTQDSLFFSDEHLNADGMDHMQDTSLVGNQNWEDLMKSAPGQDNDFDDLNMQVDFTPDPDTGGEPYCEVTVEVDATFGDYADGSETHYVVVEVPAGWTPQGEYVTVDSSAYGDGTYVAIPVPNEDLQASGGATSVPVTFAAPIPAEGGDVELDVFAVAVEENLAGGELTLTNNNVLSKASLSVEHKDMVVEGSELEAEDAAGYEDTAIPLAIDVSQHDTDGSETISITLDDIPEGATLTYTDEGGNMQTVEVENGSAELSPEMLNGLAITPPTDSDHDFQLGVSVTTTETATGETVTVTDEMNVTVDAVADQTTVSVSYSAEVVEGETQVVETQGEITGDNWNQPGGGFTIVGKDIDGDVSADNVTHGSAGFGVAGAAVGDKVPTQIGHNPDTGESEELIIQFDGEVSDISFEVSRLFQDEGDQTGGGAAGDEQGHWAVYSDGELVAEGDFTAESQHEGSFTIDLPEGVTVDEIRFSATDYSEGDGSQHVDSSDYFVKGLSFTSQTEVVVEEPHCEVTVDVAATFGDYTDGSETHYVVVEVPEGWTPVGEFVAVDGAAYGDGSYIAVPVSGDDLAAGNGAVSVPVTFETPMDGADVELDVFAVATEDNLAGGELTLTNNNVMSKASLSVEGSDLTVEPPTLETDDAAGLEDTAIPLDISASLADQDGSEVMSVTLSDIPEGAALTYTDGDGNTQTIELDGGTVELGPEQLQGLAITPPHDSDVDFDMKVSVTATETSSGDTVTVEDDLHVEVEAVADAPTLSVSADVERRPATGGSGSGQGKGGSEHGSGSGGGSRHGRGGSGSGQGKGAHSNRGHGNNVDGVDDDNPGHGAGGPNAHKEGDGIDEDEGQRGGDGGAGAWRGRDGSGHGRDAKGGSGSGQGKDSRGGKSGSGSGQGSRHAKGDDSGHGKDARGKSGSGSGQGRGHGKGDDSGHGRDDRSGSGSGHGKSGSGKGRSGGGACSGQGKGQPSGHGGGDDAPRSEAVFSLNIDPGLNDTDGSESLSVTLGPVPAGVSFSAGTDNGDGTWSVDPAELQDLQMIVPEDVSEPFDLVITATSTEAENGDSESVSLTLHVDANGEDGPSIGQIEAPAEMPADDAGVQTETDAGEAGGGPGLDGQEAAHRQAGEHQDRGHGNNADGVDDDNPGKGGGGPNAAKEGDGVDEDERGKPAAAASDDDNGAAATGGDDIADTDTGVGGDGGNFASALERLAAKAPEFEHDGAGDRHMNANAGGNGKGGDGAWFDDANQEGPPEDDVFGATDAEKEEEKRAEQEEQRGQEDDAGIQIPAEDGKVDVEFEGPEKHMV